MVPRINRFLLSVAVLLSLVTLAAVNSQAQSMSTRHVREVTRTGAAKPIGQLPPDQTMTLDVVLPLRDPAGLNSFLKELYDPSSPSYRRFLSVPEFTARFGPTEENYDAVVRYVKSYGFEVAPAAMGAKWHGRPTSGKVQSPPPEAAFRVKHAQHPINIPLKIALSTRPIVNPPPACLSPSGTFPVLTTTPSRIPCTSNEVITLKPTASMRKTSSPTPPPALAHPPLSSAATCARPTTAAQLSPAQGKTSASSNFYEHLGGTLADLTTYYKNIGQTNNVAITLLSTDGTSTSCVDTRAGGDCDDTEQTLDMTQALGMAPGLSSLVMYIGSVDTAIISAMTTHSPLPTTIGCSWGWTPADPSTLNPYFQKMAAQGQNFFAASGDSSTWSNSNEAWPADNAYVVSVGGTDLVTASAGGAWKSETAWTDSGGGISPGSIPIPSWQQLSGVINSTNKGSTTLRNGPDVAANANFTFYVCADQTTCTANDYGGTSFATPMWAGYVALVNQQLANNGDPAIGFINPTIYAQNITSSYATDFHDITSGTSGSFSAEVGYDLVTGWGSPNGVGLINALAPTSTSPAFSINASPASVSVVQGSNGTSTITTTVSGGFDSAIALTASGQPTGVTLTLSSSTIAAPGSGSSTLTMAVASTTAAGTYTIAVSGTGGGITHTATVALTVTAPTAGAFTISVSPTSGSLRQGQSGTASVTTAVSGGFDSAIALSATGEPTGVTITFTPASIAAPGSGTSSMLLTVSRTAKTGTYPITITGTGGGITHTTTLTFEIVRR